MLLELFLGEQAAAETVGQWHSFLLHPAGSPVAVLVPDPVPSPHGHGPGPLHVQLLVEALSWPFWIEAALARRQAELAVMVGPG